MRAWPRRLGLLGMLGICGGAHAAAAAAESSVPVDLAWSAPAGCPGGDAVLAEVGGILGNAGGATVTGQAKVSHDERGRWSVVLTTKTAETVDERVLDAASCEALAHATALILAFAVNPERAAPLPLRLRGRAGRSGPQTGRDIRAREARARDTLFLTEFVETEHSRGGCWTVWPTRLSRHRRPCLFSPSRRCTTSTSTSCGAASGGSVSPRRHSMTWPRRFFWSSFGGCRSSRGARRFVRGSSESPWGVVRNHRRSVRRKSPHTLRPEAATDPDALGDAEENGPHASAASAEAVRVLYSLLDALDDEKREVFVLIELEQLSAPEAAEALRINVKTTGSRLRAARQEFNAAVARHRARDGWRRTGGQDE